MAFTSPTTTLHPNGVMGVPYSFSAKAALVLYTTADQTLIGPPTVMELVSDRTVDLVSPPSRTEGTD